MEDVLVRVMPQHRGAAADLTAAVEARPAAAVVHTVAAHTVAAVRTPVVEGTAVVVGIVKP